MAKERRHEMRNLFVLPLALLVAGCLVLSESVTIRRCYDGDTCTTTVGEKIRLACIDTPELRGQRADPGPARLARDYLREMVVGRQIGIRRITTDRYGRTVAELYADGINVQQAMVRSGHAWIHLRYAHQCSWSKR